MTLYPSLYSLALPSRRAVVGFALCLGLGLGLGQGAVAQGARPSPPLPEPAAATGPALGSTTPGAPSAPPSPALAASAPDLPAPAPLSYSARKVYEQARSQLVQIRTVLKGRASQTSVGSGFVVTREGHIVTNFHVVAEAALKPERHDLVYVTADGREAPLVILQLDVLHDLALLKAADGSTAGATPRGFDALAFRPEARALAQGERIYSLGNPLDVGFAVTEGTYNGQIGRAHV